MTAPYRLIVNPIAGRGRAEQSIPYITQALTEQRVDFDIVRTERPWHAADLAEEAASQGCEAVVAVGGDGTANEVLNGLVRAQAAGRGEGTALGVLCAGRGNDFAYGWGLPTTLREGCLALAHGQRRRVDVGLAIGGLYPEGRYFGNGVGIGFDAVVGFVAARMTRLHGFLNYVVAALQTIFLYYKAPLVRVEYDGQSLTQPSLMVSVMNGRRMGGGFFMAPESRTDDGLFDLCIARQVSRARIFALIFHFMRGTQVSQEPIRMARAQQVAVTALEGTLPAHADGETLCTEATQLELRLVPGLVEAIVPAEGAFS